MGVSCLILAHTVSEEQLWPHLQFFWLPRLSHLNSDIMASFHIDLSGLALMQCTYAVENLKFENF